MKFRIPHRLEKFISTAILIFCFVLASTAAEPPEPPFTAIHSPSAPQSGQPVRISVKSRSPIMQGAVEFQIVEPGRYVALADPEYKKNWTSLPLQKAGDEWAATVAPEFQKHRHLVRYRFRVTGADGKQSVWPAQDAPSPNFAWFAYDGIPPWQGAINPQRDPVVTFPATVMRSIQAYHLVTKLDWVESATWKEQSRAKDYKYTGTFVADGKVYDHVRFRARGGDWRHAMGKNMWKFDFNKTEPLTARDDYGRPYRSSWSKLNLRACIQQGDYGHRGEQGMFESVGFRLFNLAGVAAPRTHWVHLRMVTGVRENPPSQYDGDFWGLYLAIENEDGRFLQEHELPDGNVYKMMYGQGELAHQGAGAVTNLSDIRAFTASLNRNVPDAWVRENIDLPSYFSYRSILEGIHHYDVDAGKNYDFYFNPKSRKWITIPWDIDLTWDDGMYGGGHEPFYRAFLNRPSFQIEYKNRLREVRDLLYNNEQTGALIDECAAIIHPKRGSSITDPDRAKWDYHPIMRSRYVIPQKAGHGKFYEAVPSRDFEGMVALMKQYVRKRSSLLDRLAADSSIPPTPKVTSTDHKKFSANPYGGSTPCKGMQWRVGEIAPPTRTQPGKYEITPVWESGPLPSFQESITVPADKLQKGHRYRLRAKVLDSSGRWSHWSEPVEWVAQ